MAGFRLFAEMQNVSSKPDFTSIWVWTLVTMENERTGVTYPKEYNER